MELLIPFANTGEKEDFSTTTDPTGKVSLEKGFTELYQLKPEEGGEFIPRKVFNQMMYLVTTDTVNWKTQTFPNWIDDKGDGLPYAYPKNAIVKYTDGNTYVSLEDNNEDNLIGSVKWSIFDFSDVVDKTTNQTIAGVKTFSSSPIVPTPTTGTQAVNKDYADLKVALASFIGTNQSITTNGYQKIPGGLIVQWGEDIMNTQGQNFTFPVTFPNACFGVFPVDKTESSAETKTIGIQVKSNSSFNLLSGIGASSSPAGLFYWFAIGN